jgi:hypothetical protein
MNRKLSREINFANKERPGSPILLFDLRQRVPGLDKEEFDDSILDLAESEGYQLLRHLYPECLSKQELELVVSDGDGIFFCAIIMRPGKYLLSTRRGWPQIPVHMRRVQIRGACRIPQWLADWVMVEGDEGRKVEKALIEYYGLVPPAKTVVISSRG